MEVLEICKCGHPFNKKDIAYFYRYGHCEKCMTKEEKKELDVLNKALFNAAVKALKEMK